MASAGGEGADRESTDGPQVVQTAQREQLFNQFYDSTDFLDILRVFHSLCSEIGVDPAQYEDFYASLKEKLTNWKAGALWQLLDARAGLPEYENQRACSGKRVLVVGAGPVGLRAAVEAALLGARVDLVEKRTGFTRNNSLHLWPFLITDLRNLGAKKFYGKFASGAIDHICIRILQSILLKVCLLLGVKVHPGITFTGLLEPKNANSGWSITTNPASCPASSYNYDIILAADGKQNSLPGFRTKEFRAKLALAITVNFVNRCTKQESSVPEISGVAYVYRQDFFNSMARELGIELENIVYYKDETHYFVMTAKKPSLLRRGVIKKDENDPKKLLAPENIDKKALESYAIEATSYATEGALTNMDFEKNHRGENDVALFDFTSLFASENAARIIERKGKRILLCVCGDSLLEPFWPTGSGCARGFLGAFDAAWMMKRFAAGEDPVSLLEEREAILYLLPQTTPERLQKNLAGYTIDPRTRYMNMSELVPPGDVTHLYDTDDPNILNALKSRGQSMSVRTSAKKEKPKAVTMTKEEGTPKRSRSIEGLASMSQSSESPCDISASETSVATEANTQQPAQTARHFWQKKHGDKTVKSGSSKGEKKKKEGHTPSPSKPPFPTAAKEKKSGENHTPAKTASSQKPSTKLPEKRPLHDVSSHDRDVKESLPASPDLHGPSKKKKLALFKGRSRSESPERVPKSSKKTSSKVPAHVAGHPLEAATSVKSLDRESEAAAGENEGESTAKHVLEIIEQYNKKDQSVSSQPKASGHDKAAATSTAKQVGKATTKGKAQSAKQEASLGGKGGAKKEKEKDKSSKNDKKKEVKEASSGKGLKGFFKRGRVHDEEEGTSKHPKKKAKKDKDKATEDSKATNKKSSEPHQLTIKSRIEKLKESGVYTDGSEDTDSAPVVLLSVTRLEEEEEEQAETVDDLRQRESKSPSPIEGGGEEVESPLEEQVEVFKDENKGEACVDSGGEGKEEESESADAVDRVKRLQSLFQSHDAEVLPRKTSGFGRSYSTSDTRRSKEIDLSDLLIRKSKSYEEAAHPLWLARIIQNLNKCLERLRKENDIMVAKTALVILNTIISNVQSHPDDDVYRRVRVSSDRFHKKVWQFSEARQFLARAGWVEIDDFIVLPIGSKVDVPKRVLDKHLNIVNQMLWSKQLELPDSPHVLKRRPAPRERSRTLMKRSSYATLLVEESLERIEEDEQAMAAARTKRRGSETSVTQPQGGEKEREEAIVEESNMEDYLSSMFVPESRVEEVQTMKAASAARNIWMQREVKKGETVKEREYRLVLETELYDLPTPPTVADDRTDDRQRSKSPEDTPITFVVGGGVARSQSDRQRSTSSRVGVLAEVPECENEETETVENGNGIMGNGNETGTEPVSGTVEERVKKLTANRSNPSLLTQQSGGAAVVENGHNNVPMVTFEAGSRDEEHLVADKKPQAQVEATTAPSPPSQESKESAPISSAPLKKLHSGPSGDQLKQLVAHATATGISPSDGSSREGKSPSPVAVEDEPQKSKADAQHPTESAIMTGRLEYEKLAISAAAETRQKWMETEASQRSSQKDERELSYL